MVVLCQPAEPRSSCASSFDIVLSEHPLPCSLGERTVCQCPVFTRASDTIQTFVLHAPRLSSDLSMHKHPVGQNMISSDRAYIATCMSAQGTT